MSPIRWTLEKVNGAEHGRLEDIAWREEMRVRGRELDPAIYLAGYTKVPQVGAPLPNLV
jgi:hypothetical protein